MSLTLHQHKEAAKTLEERKLWREVYVACIQQGMNSYDSDIRANRALTDYRDVSFS